MMDKESVKKTNKNYSKVSENWMIPQGLMWKELA